MCWPHGARSVPDATLGANIRIHLSVRKSGTIGNKGAPRTMPMSRYTAATSLRRRKARKNSMQSEFADGLFRRNAFDEDAITFV